ncbi:helix-turn-helix domain-containing protein [Streptomyces sp. SL13]|uniref:Helix-turn-helix domain-containing protein n=1 Tax=Streptantibioticus silvisoli TaxID=2705255 RepID=A0AA90KBG4_9ACTN|nr:TetR/AcrR family transcriptional regulator [Streptantibioticus silvisoli]MDI5973287.1 helix-turn-helix domain-containing protein [Streptantibioticus silvisoli]
MPPRVDAQRNLDAILAAAKEEFAARGVDVNVRAIAARAGVGTATLYRNFPLRSDLIAAVFRREIDACAAAAPQLAAAHEPDEALDRWLRRYTEFVATKHGLAAALHSGDPAFSALPAYFHEHLGPALRTLLRDAEAAGAVRGDVDPLDLLGAVANLCIPPPGSDDHSRAGRMVALLIDGLRYGAKGQVGSCRTPAVRTAGPDRTGRRLRRGPDSPGVPDRPS